MFFLYLSIVILLGFSNLTLLPSHFIGILSLGPPLAPDDLGGTRFQGNLQMSVICEVSSSKVSFCLMAQVCLGRTMPVFMLR